MNVIILVVLHNLKKFALRVLQRCVVFCIFNAQQKLHSACDTKVRDMVEIVYIRLLCVAGSAAIV